MTYQELVKKVQTALVKADASKIEDHIAVQVNVTGEAEGAFYMEIADRVLYVEPYDYNDRDTLLTADGAVVLAIAQSKTTLDAAVAEGKAFVDGDYDKLAALVSTFPVKKAAATKAAAKKAVAEAGEKVEAKVEKAKKTAATKKAATKKAVAETAEKVKKAATKKTTKAADDTAEKPKRTRKTTTKKDEK
ncbi:MAG: SCP2 sterol-binding domain-containing protein [Oscillospiraceae bacterium]|nr:SCP2 sterol-binding domain-containing protein [Oscillospiraceae bacterium]